MDYQKYTLASSHLSLHSAPLHFDIAHFTSLNSKTRRDSSQGLFSKLQGSNLSKIDACGSRRAHSLVGKWGRTFRNKTNLKIAHSNRCYVNEPFYTLALNLCQRQCLSRIFIKLYMKKSEFKLFHKPFSDFKYLS